MRLKGKVAIVTGTRSGIGKEVAIRYAAEGASVLCCTRKAANSHVLADEIRAAGHEAKYVECDVSQESDVINAVRTAVQTYGKLDIIVNNAGVNFAKPFMETTTEDWDRVMATDLRGTFFFCRYGIAEMLKTGGGSIINITSVHTMAGLPEAAPYDAAKWGVVGMTKALSAEFASKSIRVNSLAPGLIDTQIWDDILGAADDVEECKAYWAANIPAGRPGTVGEVASACVFLGSDEATYFNGSNIIVDGGMTGLLVSKPNFKSRAVEGGKR